MKPRLPDYYLFVFAFFANEGGERGEGGRGGGKRRRREEEREGWGG